MRVLCSGREIARLSESGAYDLQGRLSLSSDGRVLVELVPDERTLALPTRAPPERYAEVIATTGAVRSGTRLRPRRALVVQHDASLRAKLVEALTEAGFTAVGLGDPRRALLEVEHRPPHVVVAELELPGFAGDLLLQEVRARVGASVQQTVLIGASVPEVMLPRGAHIDLAFGAPLDATDIADFLRRTARRVLRA